MDLHLIGISATILNPESCGRFSACQRYLCTAFGSEDQEAIAIEYKPPFVRMICRDHARPRADRDIAAPILISKIPGRILVSHAHIRI